MAEKTFAERELEALREIMRKRRNISTMRLTFLGGTDIATACETMFHLQQEANADVIAEFNDVRICMRNAELHKRLYGDDR